MGQEERMEPGDKKGAESEVSELCHTVTVLNLTQRQPFTKQGVSPTGVAGAQISVWNRR